MRPHPKAKGNPYQRRLFVRRVLEEGWSVAEAYPEVHPRVRRAPLRRFPYGVFCVIREDRVDVLAVYHSRRRPRAFEG